MNTLKGWISTTFLLVAISMTATSARAGIIVGNVLSTDQTVPCTDQTGKIDWGIIVGNLTGIIVGNLTGIIVGNGTDVPNQSCGIIVGN